MSRLIRRSAFLLQWAALLLAAFALLHSCRQRTDDPAAKPDVKYEQREGDSFIALTNSAIGLNDNCTACHRFDELGNIPDPTTDGEWQPLRNEDDPEWMVRGTHPGGALQWHAMGTIGCTTCHGGIGSGLSYESAGHAEMHDWAAMQIQCGVCHKGDYVPGAPELSMGRQLVRESNCAGCHDLPATLDGTHDGPSLETAALKFKEGILGTYPNSHQLWKRNARMPEFRIDADDLQEIAYYIASISNSRTLNDSGNTGQGTETDLARGLELIDSARCANCHQLPGPTDTERAAYPLLWEIPGGQIGPDLAMLDRRVKQGWTEQFLADPHGFYPATRMPEYELSAQDCVDIAAWLHTRSAGEHVGPIMPMDIWSPPGEISSDEFVSHGCAACHETGDELLAARKVGLVLSNFGSTDRKLWPEGASGVGSHFDYIIEVLARPVEIGKPLMPYYDFTDDERRAVAMAIMATQPSPHESVRAEEMQVRLFESSADAGESIDRYWEFPVPAQGAGPNWLSMHERSLHPQSCAVCHREQYSEWQNSRHAMAMGPGVTGQIVEWISDSPKQYHDCLKCHAPLAEQSHVRFAAPVTGGEAEWQENPHYRDELYEAGHSCAACHVRGHVRHGPDPGRAQYLWDTDTLSAHDLESEKWLGDSRFCRDCHQFEASRTLADGGPPLQNTFAEWQEWQRRTGRSESCQDCHMPGGDHSFKGIHDADYVRANVETDWDVRVENGKLTAELTLTNSGGGHHFPTYVTPRIFMRAWQVDAGGIRIEGSFDEEEVGRDAATRSREGGGREWYDRFDTRIPAGESHTYMYRSELSPQASRIALAIYVEPDHFYHNSFAIWMEQENRSSVGRDLLKEAHSETLPEVSGYFLLEEEISLQTLQPES